MQVLAEPRCTYHVASHHYGASRSRVRRARTPVECSFSAPETWLPFSFFAAYPFFLPFFFFLSFFLISILPFFLAVSFFFPCTPHLHQRPQLGAALLHGQILDSL